MVEEYPLRLFSRKTEDFSVPVGKQLLLRSVLRILCLQTNAKMPKCHLFLQTPTTSSLNVVAKRKKINCECRIRKGVLRGCHSQHPSSESAFTINVYGVFSGPSLLRFVRVLKTDSISAHIWLGLTSLSTTNTFCFVLATCENRAEAPRGLGCGSRPTPKNTFSFAQQEATVFAISCSRKPFVCQRFYQKIPLYNRFRNF